MGKQGPCHHCGVASTPLWRNGPPEKPVLCNACGSRWRTKGTLVNYTPLHARAECVEKYIEVKTKGMSVNKNIPKGKSYQENLTVETANLEANTGFKRKAIDEEASNRSSSGSVVSNSESCEQSKAWDTSFPSKKRTCVGRPKAASAVEKLTKDLYTILQEQQSSCLSGYSEEDLLYDNTPMLIGHGSVLMRDPHSGAREVESEASSFLLETSKSSSGHSVMFGGKALKQEQLERSKSQGRESLLCSLDLKDVCNFDEFIEKFTEEEQQKLMKLLPQVDSVDRPYSLRSMFESCQFKENFSLFQQLVAKGVFETSSSSSSGSELEDIKTLSKLALTDPNKSHLLESFYMLKENRKGIADSVAETSTVSNPSPSNNNSFITIERPCESLNQNFSERRVVMRSPKEVMKIRSNHIEIQEILENSVTSFERSGSLEHSYVDNDISDQDLLLEVPSNGSFPQAELLHMI